MNTNNCPRHAVLIDDDEITLELASRQVRDSDLELVCLTSGDEGREYLRTHTPDVVLIDFRLPRIYGVELLEQVRAESPHMSTRFIIWSGGELSDSDRERCESAGAMVVDKSAISDRDSFLELLDLH